MKVKRAKLFFLILKSKPLLRANPRTRKKNQAAPPNPNAEPTDPGRRAKCVNRIRCRGASMFPAPNVVRACFRGRRRVRYYYG